MIKFEKFILDNGLKLIVHPDNSTNVVTLNILYNVGARDENPEMTGFAHLFEHLMFEGSKNIPVFDTPLQLAGGENNAFTNNDITNYYITILKDNLETAFWLESDRMKALSFSDQKLEIQKNVVIEEFNQRYLNQPYGDIFLLLRPLAYTEHPYQWPTIGKDISHIQNAKLSDVEDFFYSHYAPNNAILTVAGNITSEEILELANKWFGDIPSRNVAPRNLPVEPVQTKARSLQVERDVPYDAIYKAYHMGGKLNKEFYTTDMISDLFANGKSARLYQNLVKGQKLFSEINAYITGDIDPGLLVISGKTIKGVNLETADKAIESEVIKLVSNGPTEYELEKVKNKFESVQQFTQTSVLNKAMDLSYHELLGDADRINYEVSKYRDVDINDIKRISKEILTENNCSTLFYKAKQ